MFNLKRNTSLSTKIKVDCAITCKIFIESKWVSSTESTQEQVLHIHN